MLPSERAERFVRRLGCAALILLALYILVWLFGFVSRTFRGAVEQRELPEDARSPLVQVG